MSKIRKMDLLFALTCTLMLAVLVNIPLASAIPDEPVTGTDEKWAPPTAGGGWILSARVRGDWFFHWMSPPYEIYYTHVNHYAERSTGDSIVIDRPLIVEGEGGVESSHYNQSAATNDGSCINFNATGNHYHYARSRAKAYFYDWLWNVHWLQYTPWTEYIQRW